MSERSAMSDAHGSGVGDGRESAADVPAAQPPRIRLVLD